MGSVWVSTCIYLLSSSEIALWTASMIRHFMVNNLPFSVSSVCDMCRRVHRKHKGTLFKLPFIHYY